MTDQSFEEYVKTLKTFYIKVLKGHSNVLKFSRNFMQMMEDLSKEDNSLRLSKISRKKSEVSIAGSNKSRGIISLRNLNSSKTIKSEHIFTSPDLKKVLLYSYLHHIITVSNTEIFNIIQTKSKLLIESVQQNKIMDKIKWERSVNEWKKIMQLMNHKNKVRWEKMMNISITGLQPEFLDVVLRSILQSSTQIQAIFGDFGSYVELVSGLLKVSIVYEEYDKGNCLKKVQFGDSKYQLKIGYIKNDGIYAYYNKLLVEKQPQKQPQQQQKLQKDKYFLSVRTPPTQKLPPQALSSPTTSKNDSETISRKDIEDAKSQQSSSSKKRPTLPPTLMRKKNLRVIEALLKEYQSNTGKLVGLECFENQESKDAKIKKILESRRKIQE